MMEKLWGDNFFDPATRKWTKRDTGAETCKRGFVQFVYDPIKTIIESCMNDNKTKLFGLLDKLGIGLKSEQKDLTGKALMKATMQTWIPAHEVSTSLLPPFWAKTSHHEIENTPFCPIACSNRVNTGMLASTSVCGGGVQAKAV